MLDSDQMKTELCLDRPVDDPYLESTVVTERQLRHANIAMLLDC